ncbi:FAD-binding oxidoreductase [Aliifodinibius sp. S!AR15-10]|uniref:NAD(P)/FAD-dependent oxidoreductase n=1 Tax=Aliifodinibius sp. S!AR15-10 TaxID=2950437 RepID=UPI00286202FF|nr:FAD-dependent oxidoreductase [Aliifodinibius sp. S!AR15-10]MDR8393059.1 FAD-binding oxidoreductase [Aliifodinibius sp. S!AR15-10]
MSTLSFWEKESFKQNYDLVIIGAGITGLSTALFYKQAHPRHTVMVLEKGRIPQGASTRNAGFACLGSISEHLADLEYATEEELKTRIQRRYEGLKLLKSTLGEEEIGYEACGGCELFTSKHPFEKAEEQLPQFNELFSEITGESEVYSSCEINGYPVIKNRLDGAIHPGKMMQALIRKVKDLGVEIRWNAAVENVQPTGFLLLDDDTEVAAERMLVAANGFARNLLPDLDVQPARGFVFVTNPVPGLIWRGTFHHDRGYVYFRNIGERLLLGGGRNIAKAEETTYEFGTNPMIKNYLNAFANQVLKLPEGWQIEHEWSGIMGFTKTKTPIIARVDGRLFVAVGLSGMGIAIGMEVGKEAAAILDSQG